MRTALNFRVHPTGQLSDENLTNRCAYLMHIVQPRKLGTQMEARTQSFEIFFTNETPVLFHKLSTIISLCENFP